MKKLSIVLVTAFFGLQVTSGVAATYYVSPSGNDSNSGTQASPFRTITHTDSVVVPGDTVHVAPGSYAGAFITYTNGASGSPVTYISDTKWGAIIQGSGTGNLNYTAGWEIHGQYNIIDGFQVAGAGVWRFGLYALGTGDILRNNHVHDIMQQVGCDSGGGAGIESGDYYNADHIDIIANLVHDIGPTGGCAYIHGIYVTVPYGNIDNNNVYANAGYGIHLWHDDRNENVINNTVFNNRTGGAIFGADTSDLDHQSTCEHDDIFANNIMYNNANDTIQAVGDCIGTGNIVTNNLISTNPLFVNYISTGRGNYHLLPGSPAIGAGIIAPYVPAKDFDGVARPQETAPSIGAYEYSNTTPPSVPTNLAASAISSSQINLTWTVSTDNVGVTGYNVFRNGIKVGTSATNSYSDTGLQASTVYSYSISAYDAAQNNSAQSSAKSAITATSALVIGARVQITANLNVRSNASITASKLGFQATGALGTITGGPITANGYTWWNINYDTGVDGWSIAPYLSNVYALSSPLG